MTYYERVEPGKAEMIARGRPPRTLAVRLQLPLETPNGTGSRATCCQIRFRSLGGREEASAWQELEVEGLPTVRALRALL